MNAPAQGRPLIARLPATTVGGASAIGLTASQDGRVRAFDANTGALLWTSQPLGTILQAGPGAIFQDFGANYDLVFVGTRDNLADNTMYALNLADGSVAWSFDDAGGIGVINSEVQIEPASDRLYFTSRSGTDPETVWALSFDATSATRLWAADLGDVDAAPTLRGGRLYVGTVAGTVHALDPADGSEPYWTAYAPGAGAIKGYVWPATAAGLLYFSTDSAVHAIRMSDGLPFWTAVPVPNVSPPLPWNGQVYVGGGNSRVYSIEATNPVPAVTDAVLGDPLVAKIAGTPTVDVGANLLVIGTTEGVVYAVALPF
jgi:outer membrane protein assembly factor BamB